MKTTRHFGFLKTAVAMMMVMFALIPFAKAQTIEDGTESNPFLIESKQELLDFNRCMIPGSEFYHDGHTFITECTGDSCKLINPGGNGSHFKLTVNVVINEGDVSGSGGSMQEGWVKWRPMESFNGVFDGDYHTVSGIFCDTNRAQLGFFTAVSGASAEIKNLGIVNSFMRGKMNVGGIVGEVISGAKVSHCFFEGSLENSDQYTGGIASLCSGGSSIIDCYASGNIYSTDYYCGGVVGYNYGGCTVRNCYSNIMVQDDEGTSGGVYGYNAGIVTNCYYDKQMANKISEGSIGLVTHEMTVASWTAMGAAFVSGDGHYPYLKYFDYSSNPAVKLSVLPIFFYAESSSLYETADDLHTNFTVGTAEGATWTVISWNECVTVDNATHAVTLHRQGVADLIASAGGETRTFIIYPNLAPFLGTESNPFTIDNLTDLTNFRNGVNNGSDFLYKRYLIYHDNLSTTHWLQTTSISLAKVANWTPIGTTTSPFVGYYDGGGFTIDSMTVTGNSARRGLFGYARNAEIKNIVLTNAKVTGNSYVGGICGCIEGGSSVIKNCSAQSPNITSTGGWAGAICGYSNARIYNCTTDGGSVFCGVNQGQHVGGIVGQEVSNTISNCKNYGTTVTGHKEEVGGIVGGMSSARTEFCLNKANVYGADETGGICGTGYSSSVWYSINTGVIRQPGNYGGGTRPVTGILGYEGNCYFCINTGDIYSSEASTRIAGVVGLNNYAENCFNTGNIHCNRSDISSIGSIASSSTAKYSINVAQSYSEITSGWTDMDATNAYDITIGVTDGPNTGAFKRYTTSQLLGTESMFKNSVTSNNWLFEEGMYPRLAWTDTVAWARDIAIAASTPIIMGSDNDNADNVREGFKISGCDNNIVWKVQPLETGQTLGGCLFRDFSIGDTIKGSCVDNVIIPVLRDVCQGPTTIGAYLNDTLVKIITLRRYVEPARDTLTIDSLRDLEVLQTGVNSGEAFYYKERLLPRFADSCHFLLTDNITMPNSNWTAIGSGSNYFRGFLLGNNYTISNLHCNGSLGGLFGKLYGWVKDLNMTGVVISGGSYNGAICSRLTNGYIENCTASVSITAGSYKGGLCGQITNGNIKNCKVQGSINGGSYYTGGIVGNSSGRDTIENCINLATIYCTNSATSGGIVGLGNSNTKVRYCTNRGAVTGNLRAGGIIGESGNAWCCANIGDITGKSGCQYIGGIGGTCYAIYCYNVAAVTAESGSSTANNYVGGISGYASPQYCYNAGIVNGSNRKYVGGITGYGSPIQCYNSNTVRSKGARLGSITANGTPTKCYYDKQLSPAAGSYGQADNVANAYGYTTEEMLYEALKGSDYLGSNTVWSFQPNLYPQLKTFEGTSPSVSSAMPV